MALTIQEQELLAAEMKSNGGRAARAANVLGLDYNTVLDHLAQSVPTVFRPNPRPELERYIVASKTASGRWAKEDRDGPLRIARERYDAGTHEMCQWRDGDVVHQLVIERKDKGPCREYFRTEGEVA